MIDLPRPHGPVTSGQSDPLPGTWDADVARHTARILAAVRARPDHAGRRAEAARLLAALAATRGATFAEDVRAACRAAMTERTTA